MDDHLLLNGYTFFAFCGGMSGAWGKATDPITASKRALSHSDSDEEVVQVWYGEDENIGINDRGEFTFVDTDVVPIGLFNVSEESISPVTPEDSDACHNEWMNQSLGFVAFAKLEPNLRRPL
nr:hypothetical protein [uncultured Mediterranean phage uvMED]BAR25650.1 hypothetical protein [uncultured Mediterranean phage uvMED]